MDCSGEGDCDRTPCQARWHPACQEGKHHEYLPVILGVVRKVHQDLTLDQLENGLTFDDFNALFNAVLEVSGLKKAASGEATPVPV